MSTAAGPAGLVVVGAEVGPGRNAVLRCEDGRVVAIGEHVRPGPADVVIEAGGGTVLRGLHDHHLHLLAEAAARGSVDVSDGDLPGAVAPARTARPDGWLRLTGWRSATHGELDRHRLDLVDLRPMRVLDATGSTWYLNSAGLDLVLGGPPPAGAAIGPDGRPDGRLFRLDSWLRGRLGPAEIPDVRAVADALLTRGVTALTDATATNGPAELALLAAADVDQNLVVMTADPHIDAPDPLTLGPVKVLLDDEQLPPVDDLADVMARAHAAGRAVAVHCVTRVQLLVALAGFENAGTRPGDRIEHGSVIPDDLVKPLRRMGLVVVSQPGFLADRGHLYLDEVEPDDRQWLYRVRSLLEAGITVRAGSDAPFGPVDPWIGIAAAQSRRASDGRMVGPEEAVSLEVALALYSSGFPAVGDPADLCVLAEPWAALDHRGGEVTVTSTVVRGRPVHGPAA